MRYMSKQVRIVGAGTDAPSPTKLCKHLSSNNNWLQLCPLLHDISVYSN